MSRRHQVSRRHIYGPRQHEIHERIDRPVGVIDWRDYAAVPAAHWREAAVPAAFRRDAADLPSIHIWDRRGPALAGSGAGPERRTV